jgi:hypothetical protein
MAAELPPNLRAIDWGGFANLVREVVVQLGESALARKQRLLEANAREILRYRTEGVEPTEELVERLADRDIYLRKALELERRLVIIRRVALIHFLESEGIHVRGARDLEKWVRTAGPQAAFLDAVTRVAASAAVREVLRRRRISDEQAVLEIYERVKQALDRAYPFLFDHAYEHPHLSALAREAFSELEPALLVFFEDQRLQHWPLHRLTAALLAVVLSEEELAFAKALVRHRFRQQVESLDEMNWRSVAEEMGTTSDALRARWRRLKHRLAEVLSIVVGEMLRFLPQSRPEAQRQLLQLVERLYGPGALRRSRSRSSGSQRPQQPEPKPDSPPRLH